MLGDNMKQKRRSGVRGAQAAQSAEPGFHLYPVSYTEKMSFLMQNNGPSHKALWASLHRPDVRGSYLDRGIQGRPHLNSWCKYCFPGGPGPLR